MEDSMTTITNKRVELLRSFLQEHHLDAFIFPSTDPHQSEYIPEYWKTRTWISGFDGSAGTAVVTSNRAAVWTDSRYFLAAEEQLQGTPFILMKEGLKDTPSITEWLSQVLPQGASVGIDPTVNAFGTFKKWQNDLQLQNINLILSEDPADLLWLDRPTTSQNPICIQPLELSGESCTDKIKRIRQQMEAKQCEALLLSALDEIAWTLNLRGSDIPCNPVFLSYLIVTTQQTFLFVHQNKLSPELIAYLQKHNVIVYNYEDITKQLDKLTARNIWMDLSRTNCALVEAVPALCSIVDEASPVAMMKAIKNEQEIAGFHHCMLRDGIAMVQFLKWLEEEIQVHRITELSLSRQLTALRKKQSLYRDISFDTIAAYGPHAAIVHYEPSEDSDIPLQKKGLLLLDSGAQYQDGTTDLTRTIALGNLTEEEKRDYTLVLKGHIRLSQAIFPEGTTGTQLDICARYAMWQEGMNYLHGTGHGVGAYLNVHEGPHQIRMNYVPSPICAGMTVTDEPGLYKAGRHGIRIENTLLVVPDKETEFGLFLRFEPLTLCPIDLTPVVVSLMSDDEILWINQYHMRVYEALAPMLDEAHRIWLKQKTEPISK